MNSPVDDKRYIEGWSKDTQGWMVWERIDFKTLDVICRCGTREQSKMICAALNTRAESPDGVETCDYCNARLNAAGECDNDECDVFEYKPTPPVAGGVVISREDAEEVLAYCNADFIAQGALLNSCVLQTLTAKAIVEGRRCRMGAIAAKLEAALGERNNG